MFNRANLTPVEAAPKAFGAVGRSASSQADARWLRRPRCIAAQQRDEGVASTSPAIALGSRRGDRSTTNAFTLVELLVTMSVLVLLVLLFTQLLNSAATITTLGHKRMDADSQAREVLDRMAIDLAQMVKRSDVDYYLKSSSGTASDCGACGPQTGNDQAAFYSTVAGYYRTVPTPAPTYTDKSPVSLLSYRINPNSAFSSYNRMERLGKGLAWNGVSSDPAWTPVVFLPQTIIGNWGGPNSVLFPSAEASSQYEVMGPQVFRFEYYYLLKGFVANNIASPAIFSNTPWDTRISGHTSVSGMQDVAAIVVAIAVIDPKDKVLLTDANLATLAGSLIDYGGAFACPSLSPAPDWQRSGELQRQWQCVLDNTNSLPRPAISGVRLYERYFYLRQ